MVVAGEAFAVESGASHSKLLFTLIHCVVCIVTMLLQLLPGSRPFPVTYLPVPLR